MQAVKETYVQIREVFPLFPENKSIIAQDDAYALQPASV